MKPNTLIFQFLGPGALPPKGPWLPHNYSLFKICNMNLTYEIILVRTGTLCLSASLLITQDQKKKIYPGALANFLNFGPLWAQTQKTFSTLGLEVFVHFGAHCTLTLSFFQFFARRHCPQTGHNCPTTTPHLKIFNINLTYEIIWLRTALYAYQHHY